MSDPAYKFPQILRELRQEENLTQEEISNLLEIDRSNIANYERGKRLPSLESLIKIAEYFHVSLDYLILGREKSTPKESFHQEISDDIVRELMAENTSLMENQLKMNDSLLQKEEEIKALKSYMDSLKSYNQFLEEKIKILESNNENL